MYDDCPEVMKRTIDAGIILNEIRQSKAITYDCIIIKGDLDLSAFNRAPMLLEKLNQGRLFIVSSCNKIG